MLEIQLCHQRNKLHFKMHLKQKTIILTTLLFSLEFQYDKYSLSELQRLLSKKTETEHI